MTTNFLTKTRCHIKNTKPNETKRRIPASQVQAQLIADQFQTYIDKMKTA